MGGYSKPEEENSYDACTSLERRSADTCPQKDEQARVHVECGSKDLDNQSKNDKVYFLRTL